MYDSCGGKGVFYWSGTCLELGSEITSKSLGQMPFLQTGAILLSTPEKPPIRLDLILEYLPIMSLIHFFDRYHFRRHIFFADLVLSCIFTGQSVHFVSAWV